VSLNYEVSGEGEPLLLVMGTSGNIGLWADMVARASQGRQSRRVGVVTRR
jgi:hypothetical protein